MKQYKIKYFLNKLKSKIHDKENTNMIKLKKIHNNKAELQIK